MQPADTEPTTPPPAPASSAGPLLGLRTGLVLYGILILASFLLLRGTGRIFCLLIVGALLVKSVIYYLRSRWG